MDGKQAKIVHGVQSGPDIAKSCESQRQVKGSRMEAVATRGTSRLSADERAAMSAYAARATWPAGFVIYQRGAPADGVFVVVRGRVVLRSREIGRASCRERGYIARIAVTKRSIERSRREIKT